MKIFKTTSLIIPLIVSVNASANKDETAGIKHNQKPGYKGHILSPKSKDVAPEFDLVHAKVVTQGTHVVFQQKVRGKAGKALPKPVGKLGGSDVFSYVWPTSLNSNIVGFGNEQGLLSLALTVHPDFDDTPLYDENNDGDKTNDGNLWHSHWVVLVKDEACGPGGMKVKDIEEGSEPILPKTWPGLPIFIDSPGFDFSMEDSEILVKVPLKELGFNTGFKFDSVTSALRVNESIHAPLLCINAIWDIGSGDLSLPGVTK